MLPVTQATSATTTGHDDAFILAVCAEHAEALAGVLAHPSDDNAPASRRYLAALEAVLQIEPRTIAGLVAKARATALEATGLNGTQDFEQGVAAQMAGQIVAGLLRLAPPAA